MGKVIVFVIACVPGPYGPHTCIMQLVPTRNARPPHAGDKRGAAPDASICMPGLKCVNRPTLTSLSLYTHIYGPVHKLRAPRPVSSAHPAPTPSRSSMGKTVRATGTCIIRTHKEAHACEHGVVDIVNGPFIVDEKETEIHKRRVGGLDF